MEKFLTLYKSYENLYTEDAPLIICARALTKNNENGKIFVQLKFKNISFKVIKAVKVFVKAFDSFGNEINETSYQYLDISAKRNEEFGNKQLIELPDNTTRSFSAVCTEILFEEGKSVLIDKNAEWKVLPEQKELEVKFGKEIAEQYRRDTLAEAKFEPDYILDIWRCACGGINKRDEKRCNICKHDEKEILNALNRETLARNLEIYKKEKAKEEEEARIAAEAQKKKNKKIAAIVTPIVAIAIVAVVVFTTVIQPQNEYNAAVALMEYGKYEEAITAFEAMDGYKDSVEQIVNCENGITEREYQSAISLMEKGKYEEAIAAFEKLGDKKENETHIKDCKYNMAISFMKENKYDEAKIIFEDLNGYKDSKEKIINIRWLNTKKSLEIVGVGKYIIFGEYEQDNDNSNGKEPIEWKILDIKDDKAFVVSKYAIAYMYYDNSWKEAKTWENCDLREWLNYSFINVAFNEQEKGIIVETMVPADKNDKYGTSGGNSTQDKIFILSLTEMNKYFDSYEYDFTDSLRAEKGVGVSVDLCLRTPGYNQEYVVTIDSDSGVLREGGELICYFKFIRPAMWIDLSLVE